MVSCHLLVSLFVLVVTLHKASFTATFDCRRNNQLCQNNGTCDSNGTCECAAENEGFDCRIVKADINATACDPVCQNDGICTVNPTTNTSKCNCNETYFGDICSVPRVEVKCYGDRKIIFVNPVDFAGKMYITGKRDNGTCQLKDVTTQNNTDFNLLWSEGYVIEIMDESVECGNVTIRSENNMTIYERSVNIEYSETIITSLDEKLTARCEMINDTVRSLPGSIISASVENSSYKNTSTVNVYEPLVFTAKSGNQELGNTPMLIGTEITFNFFIPPETAYASVIVESLTANNTKAGGQSLDIIKDKCPKTPAVITSIKRTEGNRRVVVVVKVFKFVDSDQIGFTATARICKTGETDCDEVNCTDGLALQGLGRRKRESGNKMTIEKRVSVTTDPEAARTSSTNQGSQTGNCPEPASPEQEETQCLQRTEIIVVLALLASALLVLMIACIVLTWRLLRTSPKVVDVPPSDYESSRSLPRLSPSNF